MQSIKDILAQHSVIVSDTDKPQKAQPISEQPASVAKKVDCSVCLDRGIVLGEDGVARTCACMRRKEISSRFKHAGISRQMMLQTFSAFSLEYYSKLRVDQVKNRSYYETAEIALHGAENFVEQYLQTGTSTGLVFTGPVGSGKTFLACAIANELMEQEKQVLFLVVPDLLDELRATYDRKERSENTEMDLLDAARTIPVLILDDLGAHNYTEWTRNRLYSIINYRMNHVLPTVITTNLEIHELEEYLGARTTSRILQMCRLFRLLVEQDIRVVRYQERESNR